MITPNKLPLLLVIAGGICFVIGMPTLGLILAGVGGALFATGYGRSPQPPPQ